MLDKKIKKISKKIIPISIIFIIATTALAYDYIQNTSIKSELKNIDLANHKKEQEFEKKSDEKITNDERNSSNKSEEKEFLVDWNVEEKKYNFDSTIFVKKNEIYSDELIIDDDNIKSIKFVLRWDDDKKIKFFNLGYDDLVFTIKKPEGKIIFSKKTSGSGEIIHYIGLSDEKPQIDKIKSISKEIASSKIEKYLEKNYCGKNQTINFQIEINIGEKGPIRKYLDKGNNINLDIFYEKYNYELMEQSDFNNPPKTIIIRYPKKTINQDTFTIIWSGIDDNTKTKDLEYSYFLKNKHTTDEITNFEWSKWVDYTSKTYNDLSSGTYLFFVRAKDREGLFDETPAKIKIKVDINESETEFSEKYHNEKEIKDTNPPEIKFISYPIGIIDYNSVTIKWYATDDETSNNKILYSYYLDGIENNWSSWNYQTKKTYSNLDDGTYVFKIKAKDESGNINQKPIEKTFTVKIKPVNINRYATKIVEINVGENQHPSYTNPEKVLGGPHGLGEDEGSLDVLSLGKNGNITLGFDVKITNKKGPDFIVFENPIFIKNQPGLIYAELMYVEVSTDGEYFARFPSLSYTNQSSGVKSENVFNLAGINPVYANILKNDIDPFNPGVSGGDSFDLSDLSDHPYVLDGLVDLENINYIKLIDIIGDGASFDSMNNPIYDTIDMDNGADLDSIAVINYEEE